MMRDTFLALVLVLVACSSNDSDPGGIAIAGASAPPAATGGAGAPARAGTGTIGASGAPGGAGTAAGSGAAGRMSRGVAGQPSAGTPAAGAGGAVAGIGAAGAAGMVANQAGSSAAGGGGSSGAGPMSGAGAPAPTGNTPGTVTVMFMTVSYDGEYAPGNYGAVWFEAANGEFVKTAKRWAGTAHASDLVAWTEASGGWGSIFGGGNMADMMDAMSSATIRSHQAHTVTWNMKGADGQLVPDGAYVAKLEMSESRARDRAGPLLSIEFTKGSMPQTVEVPAREGFSGVVLRYMP